MHSLPAFVGARGGPIAGILAHQGGWDEIGLVLGPIAVISGLIILARRRIGRGPSEG
jgi:hypothetical protein